MVSHSSTPMRAGAGAIAFKTRLCFHRGDAAAFVVLWGFAAPWYLPDHILAQTGETYIFGVDLGFDFNFSPLLGILSASA